MKSFKTIFPSICDAITSPTCANRRGGGNLTSSHHFFINLTLTLGLLLCTQGVWGEEPVTGFEDGVALTPSSSVTSSGIDTENARTGSKCWNINYNSSSLRYAELPNLVSVANVHIIAWAKGNGEACVSAYSSNNSSTVAVSNTYQQFTNSAAKTGERTPRLYSKGNVYWDDVVCYTDNNSAVDLTPPPSATNLAATSTELSWKNGVDAMTGVQATLIFYNTTPDAIGLTLNDQGIYSLNSTLGPNHDQTGNWELKEIVAASDSSYSDSFSEGTYAVVHRDLAYNYSSPAYVTLGTACVPPTITSHPASATYSQGAPATALTVVASGTSLTYQWQESSDNSNWTNIANEITTSYTPSTSAIGTKYYRCVVTESNDCSTNSDAATITVNAVYHIFVCPQNLWNDNNPSKVEINYQKTDETWPGRIQMVETGFSHNGNKVYGVEINHDPNTTIKTMQFFKNGDSNTYAAGDWGNSNNRVYTGYSDNNHHWTDLPATSNASAVYLVGSFNDWTDYDTNFQLTKQDGNHYIGTFFLDGASSNYLFKVCAVDAPTGWAYQFSANGHWFNDNTTATQLWTNNANDQIVPLTASGKFAIEVEYYGNYGNHGQLKVERKSIIEASFVKGRQEATGTAPDPIPSLSNNKIILPANTFSCEYYDFAGWNDGSSTYAAGAEYTMGSSNVTFTAQWTPKHYNLTYELNGGAWKPGEEGASTYTYTVGYTIPTTLTKTGYTFKEWRLGSDEGTVSTGPTVSSYGDEKYFAQWTPKTTAITLDANTANHGEGANSGVTATYDNATLPAFTPCTGAISYTLTGYWTNGTGGLQVIDASGSLVANVSDYTDEEGKWKREDANLTLYAQYAKVTSVTAEWGYNNSSTCLGEFPSESSNTKNGITITTNGVTHNINHAKNVTSSPATYGIQINSTSKYVDITIPSDTTFKTVYTSNTVVNQFEIVFCSTSAFNSENIVKTVNLTGNTPSNSTDQVIDTITNIPTTAKMARIRTRSGVSQSANADLYYLKVEAAAPEEPTDVYAITGQFKGDEDWVDRGLENGQVTLTLDKETSYPFKVKKTPQGSELFTWYTDTNEGEMTENNHDGWVFNKTNGNNTRLLTAAAGQYTISVNTGGEYPVVSVVYPTSYTVSFDMQGHGEQVAQQIHIANGEKAVEPATPADVTGWHFVGWYKESACTNEWDFENETITENTTIYAKWVTAVESISISAEGGLYEIEQGSTLQLSVIYVPEHPEYGTEITWESDNTNYLSVDENGLVTGVLASENHKITATTANGKTADYTIKVIPPTCTSVWKVHMWNTSGTNSSLCLEQVGSTDEWRTGQVILPSNSDAEKVKVLYDGGDGYHTKEWKTRWIPMVGFQAGSCKNNNDGDKYAGQNAIGYLRIYSSYTDENYYLGFQPIYAANFGIDGQGESWHRVDFAASGTGTQEEYYSERFQVPANRSTYTIYVGPKTSVNGVNEVSGLSNKVKMNTITGLTDNALEGKYGFFRINANYCDASNFNCNFVREYQMSYDANGGTGSIEPQYISSLATGNDQKVILAANAFERMGYSFAYYTTNAEGTGTHFNPGGEYSLNSTTGDVIMYAQWTPNPYNITLAVGEHGATAGSATATYDATALTAFTAVKPATGYNVTGYYSNETKVLNADGTFAATDIDGFITDGRWTKAENCTLTAHYSVSTTLITFDPNGGTVGASNVTATYGQALPSFAPCQAPQSKILAGYTVNENLIINRDGTLVPNTDYADADGNWKFTGSALSVLASYRNAEQICPSFGMDGNINTASGTQTFGSTDDFTIEWSVYTDITEKTRAVLKSGHYITITNPHGFATNTCSIQASGYENGYDMKYWHSTNIDGTGASSKVINMDEYAEYKTYYITLPAGTKYIKFERSTESVGMRGICIAEAGFSSIFTVESNDIKELPNPVDNLVIHEGGQVTNETLTINKSLSYKRTIPGTDIWATISLPFNAYQILVHDQGEDRDYPIYPAWGPEGRGENAGYFFMKELTQSTEENFQNSWTHIKTQKPQANTPYIVSFPQVFDNGYFATNTHITYEWRTTNSVPSITIEKRDIETGPYISKEDEREFKLCANPNLMAIQMLPDQAAYILTSDGTCFDLVYEPLIQPMSAYVIATEPFMAKCPRIMLVGGGDSPTDFVPIYSVPTVGVENRKVMINGQMYIYHLGKIYNVMGNARH